MGVGTVSAVYESALYGTENQDITAGTQTVPQDLKFIMLELPDTTDATDTWSVPLGRFGIKRLLGIKGWAHSTNNSVVVTENPTVTVNNNLATITVPAGTDDDKRVYLFMGV